MYSAWGGIVNFTKDVGTVIGAFGFAWVFLWTVFRSFTRERVYGLLRSDPATRDSFVLGVLDDPKHRQALAKIVLDALAHDDNKHRFKAILDDLHREELEENRKMRGTVAEMGRYVGESVQRSEALEEIARNMGKTQEEISKTNAVLAESVKNMATTMENLREDVKKVQDKVDRTQEFLIKGN